MCGIVGYVGPDQALPIVLEGLRRLEYRGYDSAGVAVLDAGLSVVKREGKLAELERALESGGIAGTYSPNAAYAFGDVALVGGTTYTVWVAWKTNRAAPGVTIFAGAGPIGSAFSPTWLTATVLN